MTEMNEVAKELSDRVRGAAYTMVGLGVLGYHKAQVHRADLQNRLGDVDVDQHLADVRSAAASGVHQLDGVVDAAITFVEATLHPIEEQLPEPAREFAGRAHVHVRRVQGHVRDLVGPTA